MTDLGNQSKKKIAIRKSGGGGEGTHPLRGLCGIVCELVLAKSLYCFLSRKEIALMAPLFKLASALSCVLFVKINCCRNIKVYPKLLTLSITVMSVVA